MDTIYDALKQDHRELEELMTKLVETEGDSEERAKLFEDFSELLEKHSHAEERAFYSKVLARPETRGKTAHGVKEHCEAAELLDELKETERSSPGWLHKMKKLREDVKHHIDEEENELFPKAKTVLSAEQAQQIGNSFKKEKRVEDAG
ncbi:hemerythrin domain-containing protein [Haliangium ochraceum]|uniref:Hemerythrin HHE cation binding domain protein n=1 Tax=Haliangium ochraceum (strain DSM 14365 / JCM 11303 / SMP-2) TaxID=502025 RepID=D0LNI3_HALO1|nr:hemerythrin domain-containing protein [Haliangium ochraceum]ACY16888.1 Hemerythrin HHE cation binding domain protein [Haliangium ochraceum DSM 14365]